MTIKNTRRQIIYPIFAVLVLLAGLFIGRALTLRSMDPSGKHLTIYPQTNKLDALIGLITEDYVDTIDKNKLIETVIPEILKHLDPHTVYIPAKELEEVNQELEGNFGGIGVQFSIQSDTVMVVSVISGGPSEKLGVLPGDRIVSVNDTSVAGIKITNNQVMSKLRGEMGTKVKVSIIRRNANKPIDFLITRGIIPVYSVDVSYMVTPDIGFIKINRFAKNTYDEFITALAKLKSNGCEKVIIDLRGNSGGFLDVAFNMINEFLQNKELIVYTVGKANPRQDMLANGTGSCQKTQVVVLIDEFSASASEIFAGAIQDNDRGIIIGRRSFGKGLVQQQIPLPDGSAIRLTIARYYTPSGRCIQKSYSNGNDDYYEDIMKRYQHGEFFEKDSIHNADTIQYKTTKGRIVYGGGGIMPDLFIPRDTTRFTEYFYQLREKGALYQFALEYADKHRESLQKITTYTGFETELAKIDLAAQLIAYAEKAGVKYNAAQYNTSKMLINNEVKAYIARNFIDNDGFYPILFREDEMINAAIKKLDEGINF